MNKLTTLVLGMLISTLCAAIPMKGIYTVGNSASTGGRHFQTIAEAITAVTTNSTDSIVIFALESQTFSEQVVIQNIPRGNPTDTIFFTAASETLGDVIISSSGVTSAANYQMLLDGANLIGFGKIKFESPSNSFGGVVRFNTGSKNIFFKECYFETPSITSSNSDMNVVYSETDAVLDSIQFFSCHFKGGNSSVDFNLNSNKKSTHNNFGYCGMEGFYGTGVRITNQRGVHVKGCVVTSSSGSSIGIALLNADSIVEIKDNHVVTSLFAFDLNGYQGNNGDAEIWGNRFVVGDANAVNIINSQSFEFWHNTAYNNSSLTFTARIQQSGSCDIKNNIFMNGGTGYVAEIKTLQAGFSLSNNCYFTSGSSLIQGDQGDYNTLSAWATASSQSSGAVKINPLFKGVPEMRLTCSSDASLKSSLANANITQDFDGDARDANTPWMGADAFRVQGGETFTCWGYVHDGTDTLKNGKIYFLGKKTDSKKLLDTIQTVSIADGQYSFTGISGYPFVLIIEPDASLAPNYVKCYHNKERKWEKMQTVKSKYCNYNWDIKPVKLASLGTGTNKISGTVNMDKTGKATNPIPGLDVVLDKIPPGETVAKTITDVNGNYSFENLPEGTYEVIIDYPGLGTDTLYKVDITNPGTTVNNLNYCVDTAESIHDCSDANFIVEKTYNRLSIYPNPVSNSFVVDGDLKGSGRLKIYSVTGELVGSYEQVVSGSEINVAHLSRGSYVFVLISNDIAYSSFVLKR